MESISKKEIQLLDRIKSDKSYFEWFFSNAKLLKWFYPLKERNQLSVQQLKINENGYFQFWPPLNYLEKVTNQIHENPNEENKKYAEEILKIIDEMVSFSIQRRTEGKAPINNNYIWWSLVKILNNVPQEIIKKDISISQFQKWIKEFTNSEEKDDLAVTDILRLLLPQFLNSSMHEYAEIIIESILQIRPSLKKNRFDSNDEAELKKMNYWINDIFKKHEKDIANFCDIKIIETIMRTLSSSLEYNNEKQSHDFKLNNNEFYRLSLNRVRERDINPLDIAYKENCFSGSIQKFSIKNPKKNSFSTLFIPEEKIETKGDSYSFELTDIPSGDIFFPRLKELFTTGEFKNLNLDKADDFDSHIKNLYQAFFLDFSYVWIPNFSDYEPTTSDPAKETLSFILKNIFTEKCLIDPENGKILIDKILGSSRFKFSVFTRIILLAIDQQWEIFNELFYSLLTTYPTLLDRSDCSLELSYIFQNHSKKFTPKIIEILKSKIMDAEPEWYKRKTGLVKPNNNDLLLWRYEYVSMLKDISPFKEKYLELKEIFKDKTEPTSKRKKFRPKFFNHSSPFSVNDLLLPAIFQKIDFSKEFDGAKNTFEVLEGKPDKQGLAETLHKAVNENPDFFANKLSSFNNALLTYAVYLIRGFQEAWKSDKEISWDKILPFCEQYISSHIKDSEKIDSYGSTRTCKEFAIETASLIESGSTDDDHSFNNTIIAKANAVFEVIFSLFFPFEKEERQTDETMNYALNTFIGQIIESYFIFSLHVKRVDPENEIIKDWGMKKYNRFFEHIDEGYIYFGRFLPNMRFLDKEWAQKKVQELNNTDVNELHCKDFFESYLNGSTLYKDLFKILRPCYKNKILNKTNHRNIDKRLVEHITLAYLKEYELLEGDESLFALMLKDDSETEKKHRWRSAVDFMWSCTGRQPDSEDFKEMPKKFKEKIIEFWKMSFEKKDSIKIQLGDEEYHSFLSVLCDLTIVLDKIGDEEKNWLLECVPYVDEGHNVNFFIEYLLKFNGEENLKNILEIYNKILLSGITPTYEKENIETLIDRLYQNLDKESVNEIVDVYARRGEHFLRDLWSKYNSR